MYLEAFLRTAMDSPEELLYPISRTDTRHPHRAAIHRHPVLLPAIMLLQAPHHRTRMDMHGEDREEQMPHRGTYLRTVTDSPRTAMLRILEAHRITHRAIRTRQPSGGYAPGNGAAPGTQGGYPGDGFTQVTEQQAETLPFVA